MIKPLPLFLVSILISILSNTAYANAIVSVMTSESDDDSISLTYSTPVRLHNILNDSLLNIGQITPSNSLDSYQPKSIYWLMAGIYDQSTAAEFKIKKSEILEELKTKYADDLENIGSLNSLYRWVENQRFMKRILTPLDYDLIRIKNDLNPLISGVYLLKLHTKPDFVTVLGAVERNGRQPFRAKQNADEYIKQAQALNDSDNSFAWLIQPDGRVEHYPIAYWNQHHIEVAPGAIIYLELKDARAREDALNDNMLYLLKNWIY